MAKKIEKTLYQIYLKNETRDPDHAVNQLDHHDEAVKIGWIQKPTTTQQFVSNFLKSFLD